MHEVKIGEKGQVTLPKVVRDQYRVNKGDRLRIIDLGNGIIEMVLLKHSKTLEPPVISTNISATIEDMNKAIQNAVVDKYRQGSQK